MSIDTLAALRQRYAAPQERAIRKQMAALDPHCRRFIALSPFVVLATSDRQHRMDASPRGGPPGFVQVTAEGDLLIPDAPGNNRLDTLENIIATGQLGLLFMIPGFEETLRVNGAASLTDDPDAIAACTTERRAPKLVIRMSVEAAYLHCAKAFLRSQLWEPEARVDRSVMPTMGQMLVDQTGMNIVPESREDMLKRYAPDL